MKKLKKVWMLALLAAGFAMVIGCSNGSSDSASGDDGSGGGTQQGTGGSGDGSGGGGAGGTAVTPKLAAVTEIKLEQNSEYGSNPPKYINNQAAVVFLAEDNEWVGKAGDKVTVTIVATADAAPSISDKKTLGGSLVDCTEAAGWWNELVGGFVGDKEIVAEEETYVFSFTLTDDASSAKPDACKLILAFGDKDNNQATPVTLKVKSFDVKVE